MSTRTLTQSDFIYSLARKGSTPTCLTGPGLVASALDTPYGRIIRTARYDDNSLTVEYGYEYKSEKGNDTTFGYTAEIHLRRKFWLSSDSPFEATVGQASVGQLSPFHSSIRALLYSLASIEAGTYDLDTLNGLPTE